MLSFGLLYIFYFKFCSVSENIVSDACQRTPLKRLKKLFHNTVPLTLIQLRMDWSITRVHGTGLINTNRRRQCLNICYINLIIQCLANIASFVEWLLDKDIHVECKLCTEFKLILSYRIQLG